jgi:hypothetical protein
LNVHGDNDVRLTEIHTAEPLVHEPSTFEVEMPIEKLKTYRSPGSDQIPAGGIKFALRSINLLTLFGIKRNCLSSGRSQSLYLFIKQTSHYRGVSLSSAMYKSLSNGLLSSFTSYAEEIIRDHQCGI